MTYLTRWEKEWIDDGHRTLTDGSIQIIQALDESRSPNDVKYRQDVFPNLAGWMQSIKDKKLGREKEMAIFGPVKEHATEIILRIRKEQPIETAISLSNSKPILKVKKPKSSKEDKAEIKALRKELDSKDQYIQRLEAQVAQSKVEINQLKAVAKQAFLNQVGLMKTVGIEVTQADLSL